VSAPVGSCHAPQKPRGDKNKAFEWLDRAYELHDASFIYYKFDPLLRNLHDDARYGTMLSKLGLPLADS